MPAAAWMTPWILVSATLPCTRDLKSSTATGLMITLVADWVCRGGSCNKSPCQLAQNNKMYKYVCFSFVLSPHFLRTCLTSWAGAGAGLGDFQCCGCACSEKVAGVGAETAAAGTLHSGTTCTQKIYPGFHGIHF